MREGGVKGRRVLTLRYSAEKLMSKNEIQKKSNLFYSMLQSRGSWILSCHK